MVQPRPMPCVTSPFRKLSMAGTSIGWRRLRTSNMARGDDIRTLRKEQTMPHVIVKLWPGKSEQPEQRSSKFAGGPSVSHLPARRHTRPDRSEYTGSRRIYAEGRARQRVTALAMADIDGAGLHLRLVGDAAVWHRP